MRIRISGLLMMNMLVLAACGGGAGAPSVQGSASSSQGGASSTSSSSSSSSTSSSSTSSSTTSSAPARYSVGGHVSGLEGTLVLLDNAQDSLTVSADGSFIFPTPVALGSPYAVTVGTPPAGQTCTVAHGAGLISGTVTTVEVTCFASVPLNPPSTYDPSSYPYGFFTTLNNVRQSLGLSPLAQSEALDIAAQKHADYLALNFDPGTMSGVDPLTGLLYAHSEDLGMPGYYEATPQSRDTLAGYHFAAGEVAATTLQATADNGAEGVRSLLNTVYHRADILSDAPRYIGIGANATPNAYESFGWAVADLGLVANSPVLPPGTAFVYPADGDTRAAPYFLNGSEIPLPLPELGSNAQLGGPISLQVPANDRLTVSSFTLTDEQGNDVSAMLRDSSTDPSGYLPFNIAFLVPTSPLIPGTVYTATFSGSDGSIPVDKTWSFMAAGSILVQTPGPYVLHNGGTLTIRSSIPSGALKVQYISAVHVDVSFPSDEAVTLSLPAGSVSGSSSLQLILSDPNLSAVPSVSLTITLQP